MALRLRRWPLTHHVGPEARASVFAVPHGYHNQADLPLKPMAGRGTDVFFAGTIGEPPRLVAPMTWGLRPKSASRAAMARALEILRRERPGLRISMISTDGGTPGLDCLAYSEALMDARVSLCPRGNCPESFRLSESARAGCAIISDPLPPTWYYERTPGLVVRDWRQMPSLVTDLLRSPTELSNLQARALSWWNDVASEAAVGRYVAARVDELTK